MNRPILAALTMVLAMSVVAQAAPTPELERRAAEVHARAVQLYKQGELEAATTEWAAAERLAPLFKYAFNLGLVFAQRGAWPEAWEATERAVGYGVEARHREAFEALRAQIHEAMLVDHAWLEVSVSPDTAEVWRAGELWPAPRGEWVAPGSTDIRAEAPGHAPVTRRVVHAAGEVHRVDVALEVTPEMPAAAPEPVESSGGSGLLVWGASTLGTGVATAIVGAVMLGLSEKAAGDLRALHADPGATGPTWEAYGARYDELRERHDGFELSGAWTVAVGGLLAAGGVTLLVLDALGDGDGDGAEIQPTIVIQPTLAMTPEGGRGGVTISF